MFATSAVRISLAVRLPSNIDELDAGAQKLQFTRGQKELKLHFSIDRLAAGVYTPDTLRGPIHLTNDTDDIRETFAQSAVPTLITEARERLGYIQTTIKAIKKMPQEIKEQLLDYILDDLEAADPEGLVYALVKGSVVHELLLKCISSQSDSRASFVIRALDTPLCYRLQDVSEVSTRKFIVLHALIRVLGGKSAKSNDLVAKMF